DRPRIALTMGDPAGVGPEVIVRAWRDASLHLQARAVVFGSTAVMRRAAEQFAPDVTIVDWAEGEPIDSRPELMPCFDCVRAEAADVPPATIDARGGRAAHDALHAAARLALAGEIDALVTAPLHKAALHAAGFPHPGHTELLAEFCGVDDFAMMLYLAHGPNVHGRSGLGVIHTTLHMALRDVFEHLTTEA